MVPSPRAVRPRALAAADRRLAAVAGLFLLLAAAIVIRLFDLQVLRADEYVARAARQQLAELTLPARRGTIAVRAGGALLPVVANREAYELVADGRQVRDAGSVAAALAADLGLDEAERARLAGVLARRDDPYLPLRRGLSADQRDAVQQRALPGLQLRAEWVRAYPEPGFGGHLLGFVGYAGDARRGQYGLEGYFEPQLAGTPGTLRSAKDARGQLVAVAGQVGRPPVDGVDLLLTVDRTAQFAACEQIRWGVERFGAAGGSVVVMDPQTGAILAMCSTPDFDPERYAETDLATFNNPVVTEAYEPGSIFKVVTMAAGVDLGLVTPASTYEDTGEVKIIGSKSIRNSDLKAHGVQTMTQVLEKSLNTGAVYVATLVGKERFRQYVNAFGFGAPTGVTLASESAGNARALEKRGIIYTLTTSFGQGITVTPLQYLAAFSAVVNGGALVKPYVVDAVVAADGATVKTAPQVVRQVISARTSATVSGMLVSAVDGVYDHKAKVPGYRVGGKTGTAQIADPKGGYGDDVDHTFVGFAPADNPKFVILIKLAKPTAVKHAADSTTVVFSRLAEFLLHYYQVPPSE